jgi:hypothetical protein
MKSDIKSETNKGQSFIGGAKESDTTKIIVKAE